MKWGQRSVSRYCLLPSWQQKYYDHKNTGMAIAPLAPQKQNLPLAFSVLTNTESSISFLQSVLTSENTVSFISLLSLKKALANKVDAGNTLTLLHCYSFLVAKAADKKCSGKLVFRIFL